MLHHLLIILHILVLLLNVGERQESLARRQMAGRISDEFGRKVVNLGGAADEERSGFV